MLNKFTGYRFIMCIFNVILFVNSYTNECRFKMYVDVNGYYRKPHRIAGA